MIHVNKERLGDFIGSERKNLGLTQRDLAARLHVTDKAVSKWERGLSYPDVTLLEPLAAALDLTVEELMACRRQAAKGAEETMQSLLDISRDSVRQERRRSWQRLAAVLVLLALVCLVRCILGPRISDRVMAVNMIGTLTIIMVVVFVVHLGEAYLADIALIYAMISFLSVVVLCKVYTGIYRERKHEQELLGAKNDNPVETLAQSEKAGEQQ